MTSYKNAAEQVRFILGQGDEDGKGDESRDTAVVSLEEHKLFIQMDILVHFQDGRMGWKEQARWLKYEETVETGDRWSKPHVPTPTMHGFLEFRQGLLAPPGDDTAPLKCAVNLGVKPPDQSTHTIVDALMETIKSNFEFSEDVLTKIRLVLMEPHKHLHRHVTKKQHGGGESGGLPAVSTGLSLSSAGDDDYLNGLENEKKKQKRFRKREGSGKDLTSAYYSYPEGATPHNLAPYKPNKKLSKKLPAGCETGNILVGQVDFLDETVMVLLRLKSTSTMADLTEVFIPTRFVFLVLGPTLSTSIWELAEIGRSVAVLLNDKIFCDVAYKAKSKDDLVAGLNEFLDDVLVLPPSLWDPATRLEPPQHTISMDKIKNRLEDSTRHPTGADDTGAGHDEDAGIDPSLHRTGRVFGGLIGDIKRRYPLYLSDLKDGLNVTCLASAVFLFFACITPIVTFGGLMGQKTAGYMGTMEMLLAGCICGLIYALFSGQPLTIVGATGPLLVFESIIFSLSDDYGYNFLSFRLWIGLWITLILLIIVAFDLSAYVAYITRFTEECFSILISVIFIYEAFTKVAHIWVTSFVHVGTVREEPGAYGCHCIPQDSWTKDNGSLVFNELPVNWSSSYLEDCVTIEQRIIVKWGCIDEKTCLMSGWNLTGPACRDPSVTHSVPDVFFLSLILFVATFSIAYFFRNMRNSRFFPARVRSTLADFAVFLSIVICTTLDFCIGIETPKLNVPAGFKTTRSDRSWFINPFAVSHWWLIPLAIIPALLATILIFLDQQISAVIVNRKEHKLKKGHGYHLDLLVLSVLVLICSCLGLPWFVAATVRSITHVKSLFYYSESSMPGEKPAMLGCREQRVTGVTIHILIGMATLVTALLSYIPMPVLYGVFMYMGVTSLSGVQFFERILILFMPAKYQPNYVYLRHVQTSRVHLFTAIQLICMIVMWIIKSVKTTSIAFPLMLIALIGVRKLMDFIFTQSDLYWLDHLLPESHRRQKEDRNTDIQIDDPTTQTRNVVPRRKPSSALTPPSEETILSEKAMEAEDMI